MATGRSTGRRVGPTWRPSTQPPSPNPRRTTTIGMILACASVLFATFQFIHVELASQVFSVENTPASPTSSPFRFSADGPQLLRDNPQLRRKGLAEKLGPERKEGKEGANVPVRKEGVASHNSAQPSQNYAHPSQNSALPPQPSAPPSKHSAPPSQNAALPSLNSLQPPQNSAPPSQHSASTHPSLRENYKCGVHPPGTFCSELPSKAFVQEFCASEKGICCQEACCESTATTGHAAFPQYSYLARCDFENDLRKGSFTIEMWIQIAENFKAGDTDATITGIPFFSYATDNHDAILVWNDGYTGNGRHVLTLKTRDPSGWTEANSTEWDLRDGEWHHIAVTRTAASSCTNKCCTYSFYKDGVYFANQANPIPDRCYNVESGGCVVLGQEQDNQCRGFHKTTDFMGNMTEVRVWNSARTLAEINERMWTRIGFAEARTTASLVAVWPLNCVYQLQELVAWQNFTTCTYPPDDPVGEPAVQQPNSTLLALATIEMNDGETCPVCIYTTTTT